jgi:hypothetical protein
MITYEKLAEMQTVVELITGNKPDPGTLRRLFQANIVALKRESAEKQNLAADGNTRPLFR